MSDEKATGINRRTFLKVAGAAGAVAAAACSSPPGPQKLIPYLVPPEEIVPGMPLFYRTACRECGAGCGVTARTREGRAIKLEGNPDDPISRGALCARGQAAVQGLYAPDRFKGPLRRGAGGKLESVSWDDAEAALADALGKAAGRSGAARVRLLTRPEPGSLGALQREFLACARLAGCCSAARSCRSSISPPPAPSCRSAPTSSRAGSRRWRSRATSRAGGAAWVRRARV
jgi:anaerobic selenocysteine-containing dehydrogenase